MLNVKHVDFAAKSQNEDPENYCCNGKFNGLNFYVAVFVAIVATLLQLLN